MWNICIYTVKLDLEKENCWKTLKEDIGEDIKNKTNVTNEAYMMKEH